MISINLSIVRNVGVNIVLSSQILMLNICFYTIFRFVHYFNNTVLHCPPYICLLLDILYEGIQCFFLVFCRILFQKMDTYQP